MQEEIIMNNFNLINELLFIQYCSQSNMHQVNEHQARYLKNKLNVDIYWCSIKKDGQEFNAYLAYFGFAHQPNYQIGLKIDMAKQDIITGEAIF
jgi:hypothetical protein